MANDRFCYCRVHTIGLVVGWLEVIVVILFTAVLGLLLGNLDELMANVKMNFSDADYESIHAFVLDILIGALVLAAIQLLVTVLLIIGTVKNKHLLILPWLVTSGLSILCIIVSMGIGIGIPATAGAIFPGIIILMVEIVIWLAIYRLFQTIREQSITVNQIRISTGATDPIYKRMYDNSKENLGSESIAV